MNDFDFEDKSYEEKKLEKEKEIFNEAIKKRRKITKRVLILVFGILGVIYFAIGICLLFSVLNDFMVGNPIDNDILIPGAVFAILGFVFLDAIPLVLVIYKNIQNKPVNYDRFKDQIDKFGYTNMYDLSTKVIMMEKQLDDLYQKNEELEKEIKELKNK